VLRLIVLASAALLVGAPAATAGNVSFDGSTLDFTAPGPERNEIDLTYSGATIRILDDGTDPTTTSASCTDNGNNITCTRSGPTLLRFELGGGGDLLASNDFQDIFDRIEVRAGDGDDAVSVFTGDGVSDLVEGGAGDDSLGGGRGNDTVRGETGNDILSGGPDGDLLEGGADDDTFFAGFGAHTYSGGEGIDAVDISGCIKAGCTIPNAISLDDQPNDGEPGEGSNVRSDVEDILGSSQESTLVGSGAANFITGGGRRDVIDGLGGPDVLSAGGGDDDVQARDGAADSVRCGAGADTVTADTFDLVEGDCESVSRPAPETTITSGPEGSTNDATPEFGFGSSEQGATFQCRVDGEEFRACGSPSTVGPLAFGQHTFEVRAVDSLGNPDQTPASRSFTVALAPGRCANPLVGTRRSDVLNGTPAGDRIRARGGLDIVNGGGGADCLFGGAGADILSGGSGGDTISGGAGDDNIGAGQGRDRVVAGAGNDTIDAADGRPERINCGAGRDKVGADRSDRLRGCERVTRRRR
jgi:Ca2+-binding RTX toxin-like protein